MQKILNKLNFFATLIIVVISGILVIANYKLGFHWSPDSYVYNEISDLLLSVDFNIVKFIEKYDYINQAYSVLLPIIYLSILKYYFTGIWEILILTTNIFLMLLSFLLLYLSCRTLQISKIAISLIFILLPFCIEFTIWPRFFNTDMAFSFLVMLCFYSALNYKKSGFFEVIFYISLLLMLSTRLVAPAYVLSFLIYVIYINYINISRKKIILYLIIFLLFLILIYPVIIIKLDKLQYGGDTQIGILIEFIKNGWVVHDRKDYLFNHKFNYLDIITLIILRFIAFFSPYAIGFSTVHIIANLLLFFVLVSSLIWLINKALQQPPSYIKEYVTLLAILFLMVSLFHSFTLIDYDWRYRFPLLMPAFISVGFFADNLFQKFNKKS
jgi:hypothetical protein